MKGSLRRGLCAYLAAWMLVFGGASSVFALGPEALPAGGRIASGTGAISRSGSTMTVTQETNRMILDWNTFNIGGNASVTFRQPGASSAALNRILDQSPSQIYGRLRANGQLFLVNPSGIYFAPGARVDVGGLVASSLSLANESFLAGRYLFAKNGTAGAILNEGTIQAREGGTIAFISPSIANSGTLAAPGGSVALAAGDKVSLDFTGDRLVSFTVDRGALDALIENRGIIRAEGGAVFLTARAADALASAVVNNSGLIEAKTIGNRAGRIVLLSDMDAGETVVGGKLDASAPRGGNGGFIETSGKKVTIGTDAQVTTRAAQGRSGTWLIDPADFTIAASGGDMTGAQATAALALTDLEIQSSAGASGGKGDIFVNDSITWSDNRLTLNAYRNIEINQSLNGSGTAQLALYYGQGAAAAGNSATYSVKAPVDLPAGNNFFTKLGSDGAVKTFTVITTLGAEGSVTGTDLQGMNGNLSGNYALGADIDASATSGWNIGEGFDPVGNAVTSYSGAFDGLGHTITGLTIDRLGRDYIGLFSRASAAARVSNVGLKGGSAHGQLYYVGALVGYNEGAITNSYATGAVSGGNYAGGLVGYNAGSISACYATGAVSGGDYTGGLVGYNEGSIIKSYATGAVSGGDYAGGLAGNNEGSIGSSYATGAVSGNNVIGGLAGRNEEGGSISYSYATGLVTLNAGGMGVGGLVGICEGTPTVSDSFWDTQTTGQSASQGGTGKTTAELKREATYSGWDIGATGGGATVWRIYEGNTYPLLRGFLTPATAAVSIAGGTMVYTGATAVAGGSYAWNTAVDAAKIFGTVSYAADSKNVGTRNVTIPGLYSNQQGYDIAFTGTVDITAAPLTVTANNDRRTYSGIPYSGGNGATYAGLMGSDTPGVLGGALEYGGTSQGATGAGAYSIVPRGVTSSNYAITFADGQLTIDRNASLETVDPVALNRNPAVPPARKCMLPIFVQSGKGAPSFQGIFAVGPKGSQTLSGGSSGASGTFTVALKSGSTVKVTALMGRMGVILATDAGSEALDDLNQAIQDANLGDFLAKACLSF